MHPTRSAIGLGALLALGACDALDAGRLARRTHASAAVADAGELGASSGDAGTRDAASSRDAALPSRGEPPEPAGDASHLDAHEPDRAASPCDDEDGGAPSDSDEDGVPDCADACPLDPGKTQPGFCGCNHPDDDVGSVVSCRGLRGALVHRFRFSGEGTTAADDMSPSAGVVINTALTGQGAVSLKGGASDEYVDLPNGLISGLTNVTIEAWITWTGAPGRWQRIFDFGDSSAGAEDQRGEGASYLMLTPRTDDGELSAAYAKAGPASAIFVGTATPLPTDTEQHVALVFDDSNDQMRLYLNGGLVGAALVTESLSSIRDVNNWIGRSQYEWDPGFAGAVHELRIYDRALSDAQVMLSFASGAEPGFLRPDRLN